MDFSPSFECGDRSLPLLKKLQEKKLEKKSISWQRIPSVILVIESLQESLIVLRKDFLNKREYRINQIFISASIIKF